MHEWVNLRFCLWLAIITVLVPAVYIVQRCVRVSRVFQRLFKPIYPVLDGFAVNIMGEQGSQFTPTIGLVFILAMGLSLLGFSRGLLSPTTTVWITAGFALAAFLLVQYHDIKLYGLKKYAIKRFGGAWWLLPVKLPLVTVRELVKPVLLALGLLGNILGKDIVEICLILITIEVAWNSLTPYHFPMILCEFFTSFILAIVISMFIAVYISVVRGQKSSQTVS